MGRSSTPASDREGVAFVAVVALLGVATALPIWTNALPPLQDYPYHLAQVAVLLAGDGPGSPFAAHFTTDPGARPYAAFYLAATALARGMPVELAGRAALSLPALLWGALLVGGLRRSTGPPWGALVLLPLSLGLSHHLGFVNYLWSLPLLGLALEDLARLAAGEGGRSTGLRLGAWIAALFLTHPFTFLAFLGLAALRSGMEARSPGARRRAWLAIVLAALAFGAWFAASAAWRGAAGPEGVHWLSIGRSAALLSMPVVGMRGGGEVAWAPLVVWLALGGVLGRAAWKGRHARLGVGASRFWWLATGLAVVATFAAPFRVGHYSYLNARIPDVAFLALGMAAGGLRLGGAARLAGVGGVAAALALAGLQQQRVGRELEEVAPLLARIPAGASLLPLVFDATSPELERGVFDPHLHVHHYAHVRARAAVTPYFFRHPLAPVRYREGSPPPAPPQVRPAAYRLERHDGYAWLLVRAAPPRFLAYLASGAEEVATSGPWRLLRRRESASAHELEQAPAADR